MDTCERCGLPFAASMNDLSRYDEKCFRRIPTKANEDGCEWARQKRKGLLSESLVVTAIADARAAGYAEAKEQAAKLADVGFCVASECTHRDRTDCIAAAIRAIAPATTKEPT